MLSILNLVVTTSLACLAMGAFPSLALLAAILWGICLFIAGTRMRPGQLAITFVVNVVLLNLAFGTFHLLFYILAIGIPCFMIGMMAGQKKQYYEIRRFAMSAAVIGASLFLLMIYFNLGGTGSEGNIKQELIQKAQATLQQSLDSGMLDMYLEKGVTKEQLQNAVEQSATLAVHYMPTFFCLQALAGVFIVLGMAGWYAARRGMTWLQKKPIFLEYLPWQMVWIVIAGLSLTLWDFDAKTTWYYVGTNLLWIMAPICFYYGSGVLTYKYFQISPAKRKWIFLGFLLLAFVASVVVIIFITLLGVFDSVLDYRKLRREDKKR